MDFLQMMIGYILLWASVNIGRSREKQVEMFSKDWWVICALITTGGILL